MKDWIAANLFFFCMSAFAAAILFLGITAIRAFDPPPDTERQLAGILTVFSLFATGLSARWALRRIQR